MTELTCARARELLQYNPGTGVLTWRERARSEFTRERLWRTWNTRWAGQQVGAVGVSGYRYLSIAGENLTAHRVIWLMVTGEFPPNDIDHINGNRNDNRWANLRGVERSINMKNCARRSDNTSGFTGVTWDGYRKKWRSTIFVDGRKHQLGRHDDFETACAARKAGNVRFGFHPNHGRHP